ncbi:MAG: hypothetical protein AAFR58_05360 [Cyanobacteria bacterium J06627_28]
MTPEEFERQYQASISKILNELQSMAIVSNRLETSILEVGTSVQRLNQMVEDYLKKKQPDIEETEQTLG